MLKQIFTLSISNSISIFSFSFVLTFLLSTANAASFQDNVFKWFENKHVNMFFLRFLPIIGQHILLREYLDDDISWSIRIIKDMVQTFLPPLVALIALANSPLYTEAKYSFFIIFFFLFNLFSSFVTFGLSMYDFKTRKGNNELSYPKYTTFTRIVGISDLVSSFLFLIPISKTYGTKSEPFIIYLLSLLVIIIGSIISCFRRNVNSLGYTMRTLLIGVISYFTTTNHWQMNEISITVSLIAASLTLNFATSDLHKLEESFLFKLDHLKRSDKKKPRYYIPHNVVELEDEKIKLLQEIQILYDKLDHNVDHKTKESGNGIFQRFKRFFT